MAAPKVEPKIYTAIVLDFETGGLNCTECACTQIAMQAVRMDTWEVIDRYVSYISPYNRQDIGGVPKRKTLKTKREVAQGDSGELMKYEPVALKYSGVTMQTLEISGVAIKGVGSDVIEFIKRNTLSKGAQSKPIIIGQNILFDVGFLQQLMNYTGHLKEFEKLVAGTIDFYGNFQPKTLDTIDLARLTYACDTDVTSYKLELIAERLGVDLDDAHNAEADVTATLNIVVACSNRLRNSDGGGGVALHKKEKSRTHFKI